MNVFEVGFKCSNCGNKWQQEFEADSRVKAEGITLQEVVVYEKGNRSVIECPVCQSDDIHVTSRIPLKDKLSTVTSIPPE